MSMYLTITFFVRKHTYLSRPSSFPFLKRLFLWLGLGRSACFGDEGVSSPELVLPGPAAAGGPLSERGMFASEPLEPVDVPGDGKLGKICVYNGWICSVFQLQYCV